MLINRQAKQQANPIKAPAARMCWEIAQHSYLQQSKCQDVSLKCLPHKQEQRGEGDYPRFKPLKELQTE